MECFCWMEDVFVEKELPSLSLKGCSACWGKNWIVVVIEKSKFISLLNHDASTSLKNQHFLFHVDRNSFFLDQYRCLQKMGLTWSFCYYTFVQTSIHITDISSDGYIKQGKQFLSLRISRQPLLEFYYFKFSNCS